MITITLYVHYLELDYEYYSKSVNVVNIIDQKHRKLQSRSTNTTLQPYTLFLRAARVPIVIIILTLYITTFFLFHSSFISSLVFLRDLTLLLLKYKIILYYIIIYNIQTRAQLVKHPNVSTSAYIIIWTLRRPKMFARYWVPHF